MAQQQSKVPPRKQAAAARTRPGGPARNRPTKRGRRGANRRYLYGGGGLAAIAAVVAVILVATGGSSNTINRHSPAIGYTLSNATKVYGPLGPENIPLELGPQLASPNAGLTGATIDGVSCLSTEQAAFHHHVHLALFVDGKPYSVPLGIGFVPPAQVTQTPQGPFAEASPSCLYWIHVHATDGIIHIESPVARTFELGQFMDIWHVGLSPTGLGSHAGRVTATVNGVPWAGDPRQIPLDQRSQIVINVGSPVVSPPPISWSGVSL